MFEFFDDLAPENEERISNKRADKIKASVLSRIEEEKPMKKHFSIKPFLIAAAVAVTGAVSAVSAGAAENTNISDLTLPSAGAAKTNITKSSDDYVKYTIIGEADTAEPNGEVNSEVTPDTSYYYRNDPELETESVGGEMINLNIDRETFTKAAFNFLVKYHELHKDERKNDSEYEMYMGCNHLTSEVFYDTTSSEFKMLYEDGDGVRYYKYSNGEKVSVAPMSIDDGVKIYFLDNAVPEGDIPQ